MARIRRKCSFPECENSTFQNKNVRFFVFRKHDFKVWCKACNIDLNTFRLTQKRAICEQHFSKYDLKKTLTPYKSTSTLKENVIPKVKGEITG